MKKPWQTLLPLFVILALFSALDVGAASPSAYRRDLVRENGKLYYTVGPRAPHLFMISRDLYGDEKEWREIASANSLVAPFKLEIGQRLLVTKEPTQTEAEANRALMKAWAQVQDWDRVEGVILSQSKASPALPIPQENPEPQTETPVEVEKKIIPKEKSPEPEKPAAAPKSWSVEVAAAGSVSHLETKFEDSNIYNALNTEIDYGVDFTVTYHLGNEKMKLFANVAVERMDIKPAAEDVELEGKSQTPWHYALGLNYELGSRLSTSASIIEDDEVLGRTTPTGVKVVKLSIPQVSIGPRLKVIESPSFEIILKLDALLLLPAKKEEIQLNVGYGGIAGLDFEHHFAWGDLIYGIYGRWLQQDGTNLKTKQTLSGAKLGWAW